MNTISVVVPFFNESAGIERFRTALCKVLGGIDNAEFEILCVDDGSSDDTLEKLIALSRADTRFRVLELSRNFGKEAALTAGIDAAIGDAVIPIDSDLQDPPELIPKMVEAWRSGGEVILAQRIDRSQDTLLKRVTAGFFYRIHNWLSPVKIPKNVGDFRLIDRSVVDALKTLPEHHRFMKGLFAWVGFRTVTIEYSRNARAEGDTKFSGWKLWNFAIEGITSFSIAPLKLWTYIGILGAVGTLFYAAFIVARTVLFGADVPGYASLLVAILFIGSLQLISIGVLGEYIGRIYTETKRRPVYLIRRRYSADSADLKISKNN